MTDPFPVPDPKGVEGEPAEGPPAETTPASIAVNVHEVIDRAAEIAAAEGHSNVTTENVAQAFEEAVNA